MTKNYHICAKRDKHLPFDVFSGSSITQGCHVWHNCGSFLSFTPVRGIPWRLCSYPTRVCSTPASSGVCQEGHPHDDGVVCTPLMPRYCNAGGRRQKPVRRRTPLDNCSKLNFFGQMSCISVASSSPTMLAVVGRKQALQM
jgi:hypothetical protein